MPGGGKPLFDNVFKRDFEACGVDARVHVHVRKLLQFFVDKDLDLMIGVEHEAHAGNGAGIGVQVLLHFLGLTET